jgi:hypothetical protein
MAYFQTKNPNLGKFWRSLELKRFALFYGRLEYLATIWYILWSFGYYLEAIWYIFPRFGIFCKERSGNPVARDSD